MFLKIGDCVYFQYVDRKSRMTPPLRWINDIAWIDNEERFQTSWFKSDGTLAHGGVYLSAQSLVKINPCQRII